MKLHLITMKMWSLIMFLVMVPLVYLSLQAVAASECNSSTVLHKNSLDTRCCVNTTCEPGTEPNICIDAGGQAFCSNCSLGKYNNKNLTSSAMDGSRMASCVSFTTLCNTEYHKITFGGNATHDIECECVKEWWKIGQDLKCYPFCPPGRYYIKENEICLPCPNGTFKDVEGVEKGCSECKTCNATETEIACNATHDTVCLPEKNEGSSEGDSNNTNDSGGKTAGIVVGVIVGVIILIIILVLLCIVDKRSHDGVWCWNRRKSHSIRGPTSPSSDRGASGDQEENRDDVESVLMNVSDRDASNHQSSSSRHPERSPGFFTRLYRYCCCKVKGSARHSEDVLLSRSSTGQTTDNGDNGQLPAINVQPEGGSEEIGATGSPPLSNGTSSGASSDHPPAEGTGSDISDNHVPANGIPSGGNDDHVPANRIPSGGTVDPAPAGSMPSGGTVDHVPAGSMPSGGTVARAPVERMPSDGTVDPAPAGSMPSDGTVDPAPAGSMPSDGNRDHPSAGGSPGQPNSSLSGDATQRGSAGIGDLDSGQDQDPFSGNVPLASICSYDQPPPYQLPSQDTRLSLALETLRSGQGIQEESHNYNLQSDPHTADTDVKVKRYMNMIRVNYNNAQKLFTADNFFVGSLYSADVLTFHEMDELQSLNKQPGGKQRAFSVVQTALLRCGDKAAEPFLRALVDQDSRQDALAKIIDPERAEELIRKRDYPVYSTSTSVVDDESGRLLSSGDHVDYAAAMKASGKIPVKVPVPDPDETSVKVPVSDPNETLVKVPHGAVSDPHETSLKVPFDATHDPNETPVKGLESSDVSTTSHIRPTRKAEDAKKIWFDPPASAEK